VEVADEPDDDEDEDEKEEEKETPKDQSERRRQAYYEASIFGHEAAHKRMTLADFAQVALGPVPRIRCGRRRWVYVTVTGGIAVLFSQR
jgi:hypothetical protein